MVAKKRILLKLTGKVFLEPTQKTLDPQTIKTIATQIKQLQQTHLFSIVIGGSNILKGDNQGKTIGTTPSVGHQAGMLATMINGLMLKDLFEQEGISCSLLTSIFCPQIGLPASIENIDSALKDDKIIIFSGGTGLPFFSTDTNAIVRSLQIGANQVWKATNVDGIYTSDPQKNPDATLFKKIEYSDAICKKLGIIDTTALTLAEKHGITVRVFNIFTPNALIKSADNKDFGSTIT